MGAEPRGVIAAGHHLSAEAGAAVLREGGNAVDAAVAAVLAATVCEPLLTSLGAGGYLLYAEPDVDPILLDFFVEAPGRGEHSGASEMLPVEVSFGDAVQIFNIGPAAVGTYGLPLGMVEAARRFGTLPLADLVAPAVRLAREGVEIVRQQGYLLQI